MYIKTLHFFVECISRQLNCFMLFKWNILYLKHIASAVDYNLLYQYLYIDFVLSSLAKHSLILIIDM